MKPGSTALIAHDRLFSLSTNSTAFMTISSVSENCLPMDDGPIIGAGPQHAAHDRLTPDLAVRSPGYLALLVGQLQRRTDLVALVPVGTVFLARSLNGGQRYKAAWLVDIERLSSSTLAVHHEVTIPQVVGAAEGIAFGDTSAQGVVGIARGLGDAMARGVRFDELVVCVPGQVQYFLGAGLLVAPGALCDVAVHVVFKVQVLVEAQAVVADHAKSGVHGLAVFAGDGVQQVAGGVEGKQFAGQRAALCGQAGEDAAGGVVYTDVLWNF